MLTVILNILKILGIILLVILGVLLVTILLVLFFPVCYRIKADRQPNLHSIQANEPEAEGEPEFINRAELKAWWLFGLLRAKFRYPEPGKLKVKFLFFTLYESEPIGNPEAEDEQWDVKEPIDASTLNNSGNTVRENSDTDKPTEHSASSDKTEQASKNIGPKQDKVQKSLNEEPKLGPIEKIQYTFRNICDKIKEICENIAYYKEVLLCDDTKELLKYAFMRLGKILKSIRPRKLRADICFGTGAPDTTGYAFALYGMICPYLGKNVFVTPDFERAILKGELYAKGHITIFKVLWNGLMIVKDRRLWELKDKLTKTNKPNIKH